MRNTARPDAVEAKLVDRLMQLDLTEYEALTLVALMQLGTGTAKSVAELVDVPRTRVYSAVETLHELGLVDIQHTTPRKFTVISRESVLRKLDARRKNTITEIAELGAQLRPVESSPEEFGAWTVNGHEAVTQRVSEFVDEADDEIIYMTVDDFLTDEQLAHLEQAEERGVDIHIAGLSDEGQARIRERIPSAQLFETLWAWSDTSAGRLLITDQQTALVSVRSDADGTGGLEETAIWGSGDRNSLVVVLRTRQNIFLLTRRGFTWACSLLPMPKTELSEPTIRFDSERSVHRASFDPDSEPVSDAVVWTLAEVTDREVDELDPIASVVDPIVFDALVRRRRQDIQVGFTYNGHNVRVDSRGEVLVQPIQSDEEGSEG